MIRIMERSDSTVDWIAWHDEAVQKADVEASQAAYHRYLEAFDRSHLDLSGEPTVFALRCPTQADYDAAAEVAGTPLVPWLSAPVDAARELLRRCCAGLHPWPEALGPESIGIARDALRRRCLSPAVVAQLPGGLCRDAAFVLLRLMPQFASDAKKN
jgi:hypothetical protein